MTFQWLFFYDLGLWALRGVMLLVILRRRLPPATGLAWLTIIFLQPLVGVALYGMFGDTRLGRRRVRLHRDAVLAMRVADPLAGQASHRLRGQAVPAASQIVRQAERITGMPIVAGNHVELVTDTTDFIDRLVADIDRARAHVHLQTYILAPDRTGDRVGEALLRARGRGVACRVLADAVGSRDFFESSGLQHRLMDAGVAVWPMLPVSPLRRGLLARIDVRNHRKLAVIDGEAAYAGSQNIADDDVPQGKRRRGAWVDLSARLTGPIVAYLQVVFLEDWAFDTGETIPPHDVLPDLAPTGGMTVQAVPTGPGEDESDSFPRVIIAALSQARERVVMTTPYFIPDEPMQWALEMAAERGVEVHLVLPERSDHWLVDLAARSYFERLLASGVHVHLYQGGVLHSKALSVDDDLALVGSANFDVRSFYVNYEISVLLYGPEPARLLRRVQQGYVERSRKLDLATWKRRSRAQRYAQGAAALLSPLL